MKFFTSTSKDIKETSLYRSILKHADIHSLQNEGKFKLSNVFNNFVTTINDPHEIYIFCHDDITIENVPKLQNDLIDAFKLYDVVGVAGCQKIVLRKDHPNLWHLMCPNKPFSTARGRIKHNGLLSDYGKTPSRVLILDGVFMAFRPGFFFDYVIKWDEENPSKFHFYDIDFCLQCNLKQIKLGVYPIEIDHASEGLRSINEEWELGNKWFYEKWSKLL